MSGLTTDEREAWEALLTDARDIPGLSERDVAALRAVDARLRALEAQEPEPAAPVERATLDPYLAAYTRAARAWELAANACRAAAETAHRLAVHRDELELAMREARAKLDARIAELVGWPEQDGGEVTA